MTSHLSRISKMMTMTSWMQKGVITAGKLLKMSMTMLMSWKNWVKKNGTTYWLRLLSYERQYPRWVLRFKFLFIYCSDCILASETLIRHHSFDHNCSSCLAPHLSGPPTQGQPHTPGCSYAMEFYSWHDAICSQISPTNRHHNRWQDIEVAKIWTWQWWLGDHWGSRHNPPGMQLIVPLFIVSVADH